MIDTEMPTYLELLVHYPDYTFPHLELDTDKFPTVALHISEINELFYGRNFDRRINRETVVKWFEKLQYHFNEILPEFEQAYGLYAKHVDGNLDVLDSTKTTFNQDSSSDGINQSANPTTPVSEPAKNIDSIYSGLSVQGGNSHSEGWTTVDNNQNVLDQVNMNIDRWKNLNLEFVKRFDIMFMKVMW